MLGIILSLVLFLLIVFPTGSYLFRVASKKKTFADPVFDKLDGGLYKLLKINGEDMTWKEYALSLILLNACLVFVGYLILRIQSIGLFNPNKIGKMEESLAFNTIVSFMTNTNLQHYAGESGLSYFSQMFVIIMMMFTSAATGFAACMAMIRGLLGKKMGNFYVDFIRVITRFFLPLSIILGLVLVGLKVPQNLSANTVLTTIEGKSQTIAQGPIAALEIIKHLGTNGGGFLGANSSTPLENPSIYTNLIEMISMMLVPGSCVIIFGKMAEERIREKKNIKKEGRTLIGKEGLAIFITMSIIFILSLIFIVKSERSGNKILEGFGISQLLGNMEGKEVRFGVDQSALFTNVTTSFTTGTVNNMHDSLTPLGGMVPLLNMMLNLVFGGAGVGLMNILVYAILAVFICGLMIGRTPEYLDKKIEGKEMKLAALAIIIHPLLILGFSALALSLDSGRSAITNPGFHGLSQVLYEYTSAAANNGSGFEGLSDNTFFWNMTAGIVMFLGRYLSMIIQLGIAGSLLKKKEVNESIGSLKTNNLTFSVILVVVIYIFAALTFLPALALGPIAEFLSL
ncbi:MAG: potassium-transporting ATPase subunit KdpA [Anaerococcus sp.]|nr:potassium-transporting ATPase subunit KdpA [Peptoniphilaceae bacterium]MDY3055874.1 potassium-transporting ATPase subunit KdpA [Anaerococcus sp.]